MTTCFKVGCTNTGVHYRDVTYGPLADIRHYCDEHVAEADRESARTFYARMVEHSKFHIEGLKKNHALELEREQQRLADYEAKLAEAISACG